MNQRPYRKPYVMYEINLRRLVLEYSEIGTFDATSLLSNGRANYILIEKFIAYFASLLPNSQGAKSDLVAEDGTGYEVKSYRDPINYPKNTKVHTAASNAFGPNNNGPIIKCLLEKDRYDEALRLCRETGYDKSDYYIYVNSAKFETNIPLRYVVIPTKHVMRLLSPSDPRVIDRTDLLNEVKEVVRL